LTKLPYIKPTKYKHDSGYRTFEVGYCNCDNKHNAVDIEVKGTCSDHIWIYGSIIECFKGLEHAKNYQIPKSISMDLTCNGYIRLYTMDEKGCELKWVDDIALSSATLVLVKKSH